MSSSAQVAMGSLTTGEEMFGLAKELYPICRSITGNGVRQTLARIQKEIPIHIHEVATGTQVFDWTVPREWNIQDAYIKDGSGRRVVDFRNSNLHVVNYSIPARARMSLTDLRPHLHTLPDRPDWIPYRTTYYKEDWGFCLSHRQLSALPEGEYEICIDSSLKPGSLTYGEFFLRGETEQEVLVSCHICHPSLCNDNLSGIVAATALAQKVAASPRRFSYRFLFIPGTIGAITWLARNESVVPRIRHGVVLAGVGDRSPLAYKKSRRGNAEVDRAFAHLLSSSGHDYRITDFSPYGYDERQFCSPGFNLPVGRLSRAPHGEFPEYHTSADNLEFVSPESLTETVALCSNVFSLLESNHSFQNLSPKCEPQLGKRGLYRAIGGSSDAGHQEMALLWVLNLSDGTNSLLDIAERSGLDFESVRKAAHLLEENGLLRRTEQALQAPSNAGRLSQ